MNIDNLLKEKGMTKVMLAEKMGIRSQNVNVSLRNPTEETSRKIAEALDVPLWRLFLEEDSELEDPNTITCPKCGAKFELKE